LAGYAALIAAHGLTVPLPRQLSATDEGSSRLETPGWRLLTRRHAPQSDFGGHLTFALKHEGLDLAVLKRLFQAAGPAPVESMVRETPTGRFARRAWFLYEWLTGEKLDLPDAEAGAYVHVVDPKRQWASKSKLVRRQRVRDNLPGTPRFCPLVTRTERLARLVESDLLGRASEVMGALPADLLARTAAFLQLEDSKSSFAIEGEQAPADRMQRWATVLAEAGRRPLDLDELLRMQRIVIGDARFVHLGLREEGGFIGEHDRHDGTPIPVHVSARPGDLDDLVQGLLDFERDAAGELSPGIAAAVLAFGFVYVHPFEDGNGRVHRALIHQVLARRRVGAPGVVLPVSAVMLKRLAEYRAVLEDYSGRLLPVVDWTATAKGNVEVSNDTADFYRFFDATAQAEFLMDCLRQTIDEELPHEVDFLRRHDRFSSQVSRLVEMPGPTLDLLFRFLRQGGGRLSKRAREREFAALTDDEVRTIEGMYADAFGDLEPEGRSHAGRGDGTTPRREDERPHGG